MRTHGRVTPGPVGLPAFRSRNDQRPRRAAVGRCKVKIDNADPVLVGTCDPHSSLRVGHLPGKPWPLRSPALPLLLGEGGCSALGSRFSGRCYCGGVRGQVGRARCPKAGGLGARQASAAGARAPGAGAVRPCVRLPGWRPRSPSVCGQGGAAPGEVEGHRRWHFRSSPLRDSIPGS